jgi:hypothetical protein
MYHFTSCALEYPPILQSEWILNKIEGTIKNGQSRVTWHNTQNKDKENKTKKKLKNKNKGDPHLFLKGKNKNRGASRTDGVTPVFVLTLQEQMGSPLFLFLPFKNRWGSPLFLFFSFFFVLFSLSLFCVLCHSLHGFFWYKQNKVQLF